MELVCVFLPQTELFVPFAAFFVAVCLVLCIFDAARKAALCILLGAAVGMASVLHTANRLERIRVQYAGRPLVLTAEVESTADSYDPGIVDAVLHVEKVNGSAESFRVECSALPECKAGERVQGRFILSAPASGSRVSLYADGIALQAEMDEDGPELTVLGESDSFRARTHRLQQRLSASLRRRMDGKTGGVLAAMTTGDRSYLSSAMRSAYRGAGLAHVLVVSGMHVSILCGDILSTLLPYEWEQSYRRRRHRAVFRSLLAFLLMGVTGFTPSVCRAAVAVWVGALGVWLYGPPDTLTSLAVAGIVMTAGNSYAVCDIGFELSFAAVVGTVAGGVCIRRARDAWYRQFWKNAKNPVKRPWYFKLPERLWGLAESICISFCASVATFPVLVLRGLSVSIYAVVSSVAVLWLGNLITLLPLLSIIRTKTAADRWEGLTVLIFAALGIYMILKGIRKKKVLERRKDEIEWKKTTLLALVTSVDAFFVGMGLGFLDTAMIEESLVLFPVTVLEAVIGIFAGYRLGLKENRRAYWVGGALLLLASFDVILHYYT